MADSRPYLRALTGLTEEEKLAAARVESRRGRGAGGIGTAIKPAWLRGRVVDEYVWMPCASCTTRGLAWWCATPGSRCRNLNAWDADAAA